MLPKLLTLQQDVTQLNAQAQTRSDQSRLSTLQTGLGQLHTGLLTISEGDASGMTAFNEGMGTISASSGFNNLDICGSGPTAS